MYCTVIMTRGGIEGELRFQRETHFDILVELLVNLQLLFFTVILQEKNVSLQFNPR